MRKGRTLDPASRHLNQKLNYSIELGEGRAFGSGRMQPIRCASAAAQAHGFHATYIPDHS